MHPPVDARLTKATAAIGCLAVFGGFFALMMTSAAIKAANPAFLAVSILGLTLGGALPIARRFSIARIDERGIHMRSGKLHPWDQLVRIQQRVIVRRGMDFPQYSVRFRSGSVELRRPEYENWHELWAYLEAVEGRFNAAPTNG